MRASVQYNDYRGTTAADRSDLFVESPSRMTGIILESYNIPLDENGYQFIGISAYGIKADDMGVTFFLGTMKPVKL